jgi:hypothetical protein
MLSSKAETFHILGTYQVVADIFRANPFGWPPEAFIIFIDGQYGLGSLPLGYVDSRFARV